MRKLTVPMPLVTIQRGACPTCQSLNTTATPSPHPRTNVAIASTT